MYLFIPCTMGPNILSIHIFLLLNSQEKYLSVTVKGFKKLVFRKYIVRPYSYLSDKQTCLFIFSRSKFHPTCRFSCNMLKIPSYPFINLLLAGRVDFPSYPFIQAYPFIREVKVFSIIDIKQRCSNTKGTRAGDKSPQFVGRQVMDIFTTGQLSQHFSF